MTDLFLRELQKKETFSEAEPYLKEIPAIRDLDRFVFRKPVTFFCGENGSGKSTLLEAVAVGCGLNAEGGSTNFAFSTKQTHSELYQYLRIVRGASRPQDSFFLRAESFYNVASEIEDLSASGLSGRPDPSFFYNYGGESLHCQSHGESFLAMMQNRFRGQGIYLLDEPEAALSPTRQFAMLCLMRQLVQNGSQLLIATHSPILTAFPDAEIYVMGEDGMHVTPYRQTENYILTRHFLANPEGMLQQLFAEDD